MLAGKGQGNTRLGPVSNNSLDHETDICSLGRVVITTHGCLGGAGGSISGWGKYLLAGN